MIVEQASNLSMIVDKIIHLNSTNNSFLNQKINVDKIFAAGHSLGGAASFMACGQDRRIAKGINLDGAFIDEGDTNYADKELLLIHADRDKDRPKNKKMQSRYDAIMNGDKIQIDRLATKADLQKLSFPLSSHFNFSDLSIIIQPVFTQSIGLVGKTDGLELLSKTAIVMCDFFNK